MKKAIATIGILVLLLSIGTKTSSAGMFDFTGDPISDGWTKHVSGNGTSNSLDQGVYIRGAGLFSYDVYVFSFQVHAASPLITNFAGTQWQEGDVLFGIGGVLLDNLNVAGDNAQLTTSLRIIAKYGTSTSTFSTGTAPNGNNGAGSFSGGNSGDGGIQLSTFAGNLSQANAGTSFNPDSVSRFSGGVVTDFHSSDNTQLNAPNSPTHADLGRVNYLYNNGLPTSFGVLLNVSLAGRLGFTNLPNVGDKFDLALQRGTSSVAFNDALGNVAQVTPNPFLAQVPEPSSIVLLSLGLGGMVLGAWRARSRRQTI